MKWNVPLTYAPKIQGVTAGTIRKGRKYTVGDHIEAQIIRWDPRLQQEAS